MAYYGEHKLRKMQVIHPIFKDAQYIIRFSYNDGVIYAVPVIDGVLTVDGSLLRYEGEVQAQFFAYVNDDDGEDVQIFESEIFSVFIGKCLDSNLTAIPTYEQAKQTLNYLLSNFSGVSPGEPVIYIKGCVGFAGSAQAGDDPQITT